MCRIVLSAARLHATASVRLQLPSTAAPSEPSAASLFGHAAAAAVAAAVMLPQQQSGGLVSGRARSASGLRKARVRAGRRSAYMRNAPPATWWPAAPLRQAASQAAGRRPRDGGAVHLLPAAAGGAQEEQRTTALQKSSTRPQRGGRLWKSSAQSVLQCCPRAAHGSLRPG